MNGELLFSERNKKITKKFTPTNNNGKEVWKEEYIFYIAYILVILRYPLSFSSSPFSLISLSSIAASLLMKTLCRAFYASYISLI